MAKENGETSQTDRGDRALTQQERAARLPDEARREIQARASPEGLVAILFTDDVGSTRIRQRLGDQAAQERFRQHNEAVREQIAKHGGFEVKTWGDAFMVVFSDVTAALACAVDIQRAVSEDNERHPNERIEVRLGLNAGQAIKEEEDFFGGAVVVAARLQGLAKGGQILVSEAVRVLAGLPEGIGYIRQGRRQLKGLEGSYDIWRVPWREEQPSLLARLWARPAFRVVAPLLLLAAIGGGVAGGVVLSGGGGGGELSGTTPLTFHDDWEGTVEVLTGDCVSEDLVAKLRLESQTSGDLSGHTINVVETISYAAESCLLGTARSESTLTDPAGNTLLIVTEGPFNLAGEGGAVSYVGALIVIGGTGIYEGAAGQGTCTVLGATRFVEDVPNAWQGVSDCQVELSTAGAVAAAQPVIVQLGASSTEVELFAVDLPSTVAIVVLYRNTRDDAQRGLSLTLREPEGARIRTTARETEDEPVAGERLWSLPDLPPGEIARFEFTLQFLSVEDPAVPLIVEIDGDGFDEPVRSDPITIDVVQ